MVACNCIEGACWEDNAYSFGGGNIKKIPLAYSFIPQG